MESEPLHATTRQERREKKLTRKRERMVEHGKSLGRLYKEAILKQVRLLRNNKEKTKKA
jgi:hypothetical protein